MYFKNIDIVFVFDSHYDNKQSTDKLNIDSIFDTDLNSYVTNWLNK